MDCLLSPGAFNLPRPSHIPKHSCGSIATHTAWNIPLNNNVHCNRCPITAWFQGSTTNRSEVTVWPALPKSPLCLIQSNLKTGSHKWQQPVVQHLSRVQEAPEDLIEHVSQTPHTFSSWNSGWEISPHCSQLQTSISSSSKQFLGQTYLGIGTDMGGIG